MGGSKHKRKFRKFDENYVPPTSDGKKLSNSLNTSSDLSATSDSSRANESVDSVTSHFDKDNNSEIGDITVHHRGNKSTLTTSVSNELIVDKIKYNQNLSYTTDENSNTGVETEVATGFKNITMETPPTNKRDFNKITRKKSSNTKDSYQFHAEGQNKRGESYASKASSHNNFSKDKNYTSSYDNQKNSSSRDYTYPKRNSNNFYPRASEPNISRGSDRFVRKLDYSISQPKELDGNTVRSEVLLPNTEVKNITSDNIQESWDQNYLDLQPEPQNSSHCQNDKQLERKESEFRETDVSRDLQQDNSASVEGTRLNVYAETFQPSRSFIQQKVNKRNDHINQDWGKNNTQNNMPDDFYHNTYQQKLRKTQNYEKDFDQKTYQTGGHGTGDDHIIDDWGTQDNQNNTSNEFSENTYQQKTRKTEDYKTDFDQKNYRRRGKGVGVDHVSDDWGEQNTQNNTPDDFAEYTYQQKPRKTQTYQKDIDQGSYQRRGHNEGVGRNSEDWDKQDPQNNMPNDSFESTYQQKPRRTQGYKKDFDQKGYQRRRYNVEGDNISEDWGKQDTHSNVPNDFSKSSYQQKLPRIQGYKKDFDQRSYQRRGHNVEGDNIREDWDQQDTQNNMPNDSFESTYQQKPRRIQGYKKDFDQRSYQRRGHNVEGDNIREDWDQQDTQNNMPNDSFESTYQQKPRRTQGYKKDFDQRSYRRRGHNVEGDNIREDWDQQDTQNNRPNDFSKNTNKQKPQKTQDYKKDFDQNSYQRTGHNVEVDNIIEDWDQQATENNTSNDFSENTYQQKPRKTQDNKIDSDQKGYQRRDYNVEVDNTSDDWDTQDAQTNMSDSFFKNTHQQKGRKTQDYKKDSDQKDYQRRGHSLGHDSWRKKDDKGDVLPKRFSAGVTHSSGTRTWKDRDLLDRSFQKVDKEYTKFQDERQTKDEIKFDRVSEIEQDLFTMSKEYSLAHCVAEDMRMGSGIAVNFKRDFKDIDILLNQRQKQGGLALLEQETADGIRYIYYLVTKRVSNGKPTYETLWSSLKKMREHIIEHEVKKLAIPRLGCGLDRLEWTTVKHMLEFLFRDVDIEIIVCNFQQNYGQTKQKLQTSSETAKSKKSKSNKKKKS